MIKSVVFDIDNTLFSHYSSTIPKLTIKALEELKKNKTIISINTSREKEEFLTIPVLLFDYVDFITVGTGTSSFNDNVSYHHYIDKKVSNQLITYFEENNISYRATLKNSSFIYSTNVRKEIIEKMSIFNKSKVKISNAKVDEDYPSFLVFDLDTINFQKLKQVCIGCYCFEWDNMADILPENISKATGICDLCSHYGFSKDEVVAFGDGDNDIKMLEYAKIGVATKQASKTLKEKANYICQENIDNGGIYFALIDLDIIHVDIKICFLDVDLNEEYNFYALEKAINKLKEKNILLCAFNESLLNLDIDYLCTCNGLYARKNEENLFLDDIKLNEINKGSTMLEILHYLNIDVMKTIAFSDKIDKDSLLEKAYLGINLSDNVQEIHDFDYQTDKKDGILKTLKLLKLI